MNETSSTYWKKCSSCKKPIGLGATYYTCSVSTCNGQRTGYVFCTIACFEHHLPGARHKDAAAIEMTAPKSIIQESGPRKIIPQSAVPNNGKSNTSSSSQEVLVVASRLKEFIDEKSGFNTSSSVMEALSQHLRIVCERGIENARNDGRKTVMDRDFIFLKNLK